MNILGRVIILFGAVIFPAVFLEAATVSLVVRDMEGRPAKQVAVGVPFTIDVVVDGLGSSAQVTDFKGIQILNAKKTSVAVSTVNGKSSMKTTYQLRADKVGRYTVGPVTVGGGGEALVSEPLSFVVTDNSSSTQRNDADRKPFLSFALDKKEVFVGESVRCSITLYWSGGDVACGQVIFQPTAGFFTYTVIGEPLRHGPATIHGVLYDSATWEWDLFPQKSGDLIVPACYLDLEVEDAQSNVWGVFGIFLQQTKKRKRLVSNAVHLLVKPLPDEVPSDTYIGTLRNVHSTLTPHVARVGEAMVLKITLEGEGRADTLQPPIVKIDSSLIKIHFSCATLLDAVPAGSFAKEFEYVVHGIRSGKGGIPAQKIFFFDTEHEMLKSISTAPILFEIVPSLKPECHAEDTLIEKTECVSRNETILSFLPYTKESFFYCCSSRANIPWCIFYILLLVPLLVLIGYWWAIRSNWKTFRLIRRLQLYLFYNRTKKAITESNDAAEIGEIVRQFFVAYGYGQEDFSEKIVKKLREAKVSEVEIAQWRAYVERFFALQFSPATSEHYTLYQFRTESLWWIKKLSMIL